jgi:acetyltransferase-like isoleucine patch superfamily enzyme
MLGYRIDRSARIGFSVLLCRHVILEPRARIGHFNVVRNLDLLHLHADSQMGQFNSVSGCRRDSPYFRHQTDRNSELIVGRHASITSEHRIDCSNRVVIGAFTVIAGYRSQFLTHSVDLWRSRQESSPVRIGDYCFVGTGCTVLGGAELPSYSVLAAKALLKDRFHEQWSLYGGVPATKLRAIDKRSAFFSRTEGHVY